MNGVTRGPDFARSELDGARQARHTIWIMVALSVVFAASSVEFPASSVAFPAALVVASPVVFANSPVAFASSPVVFPTSSVVVAASLVVFSTTAVVVVDNCEMVEPAGYECWSGLSSRMEAKPTIVLVSVLPPPLNVMVLPTVNPASEATVIEVAPAATGSVRLVVVFSASSAVVTFSSIWVRSQHVFSSFSQDLNK